MEHNYIVSTIRPWNIKIFNDVIINYPGTWFLITEPESLNIDFIKSIKPRYIFFPHWSDIVPEEIINFSECVCFHETDLPFGRGGSPIQNLISKGYKDTMLTALKMTKELDAGPIYFKRKLSLEGVAEEIYIRAANIVSEMIERIIIEEPTPKKQKGDPVYFKRRTENQSELNPDLISIESLYNHIRMLDAPEYPKAFVKVGKFKFEISRPNKSIDKITARLMITKLDDSCN